MRARTTAGAIGLGLAAIVATVAVAPMTGRLEAVWQAVVLVPLVVLAATIGYRASPWGGARAYVGLFVLAVPTFVAVAAVETPLLGGVAEGPVAEVATAWWATGFRLTDAVARTDLRTSATADTVRAKPRRVWTGTYTAAPIVPPTWTPAEPVRFWIVDLHTVPADWSRVRAAGVRWAHDPVRDAAIADIAARAGLVSAETRILLRAVDDPDAVLRADAIAMAGIVAIAGAAWTAAVLVGARWDG